MSPCTCDARKTIFHPQAEPQLPLTDPAQAAPLGWWCCHANAPWTVPGNFNNQHGYEDGLSSSSSCSMSASLRPHKGATCARLGGQCKSLPDIFAEMTFAKIRCFSLKGTKKRVLSVDRPAFSCPVPQPRASPSLLPAQPLEKIYKAN